jgi:6-pyruvoyl-tetrahydropterin synthase related domain
MALFWCALALLAGVIVMGLVKPLLTLVRFIPLDPNEGWNAYFSLTAIQGGQLYPAAGSLLTNNYPPLSFYIVGAIGYLTGDNIFAGRCIALLCLLFVAWSIYYWLRLTGSAVKIGLLGATVFLAYAVTYGRVYVAMDDPQWLAEAIMMSGLLVLWQGRDSTRHIIAASILMIAAGWTKHLLLPIPLAVTVWLFWRSKPAFARWAICSMIVLAVASGLAWWLYGAAFFDNLLAPRQYVRHQAVSRSVAALKWFAPLLGLWLIGLVRGRFDERFRFVSLYLLIAGVIAVFASGGAGVDVNSFFDVMIAASLASVLVVGTLEQPNTEKSLQGLSGSRQSTLGPATAVALAVCVVSYAVSLVPLEIQDIEDVGTLEKAALEDINVISAQGHGRAACEIPGLCYWAKSPFMVDFFFLGQRLKTGIIPASTCARAFDGEGISLLELDPNPKFRQKLLPPYCNEMITSHYRPIRQSRFGPLLIPAGGSSLK